MSTNLFDLSQRVALITGSSRGLGRAMAQGLAEAGAKVLINGIDADRAAAAVQALRAAGHDAEAAVFDVTDEAAVQQAFADFDARGLAVDILINNAGIQLRKPMLELSTENWQLVMQTNLTSAFVVGREAARRMVPRKRGKIINIGSLLSTAGYARDRRRGAGVSPRS